MGDGDGQGGRLINGSEVAVGRGDISIGDGVGVGDGMSYGSGATGTSATVGTGVGVGEARGMICSGQQLATIAVARAWSWMNKGGVDSSPHPAIHAIVASIITAIVSRCIDTSGTVHESGSRSGRSNASLANPHVTGRIR